MKRTKPVSCVSYFLLSNPLQEGKNIFARRRRAGRREAPAVSSHAYPGLTAGCCPHIRLRVMDQDPDQRLNHFPRVDLDLDLDLDLGLDVDVDTLIRDTFSRAS